MQQTIPTEKQERRARKRYALAHSLYITKAWNWFLELMGRAAEAILVLSVLYASVKLLPVVHMPTWLDVIVFIAQFVALDVGGLSLGKLAKQARTEGNEEGASQAGRMSKALITVMIAGVVVVAVEQLFPIPGNWKIGIDTVLLIARSILAVLYGHIIHSLRKEDLFDQAQPHDALHVQPDFHQLMTDLQTEVEQRLAAIESSQARMLASIQQMQNSAPVVDQTAIVNAVIEHFSEQFEMAMQRLAEQRVQVSPVNEHPALPERLNVKQRTANTQKIVRLTPRSPGTASHQETIFRLLREDETRGPRELARLAGCSPATAKSYRDLYFASRSERNGTSDEQTD